MGRTSRFKGFLKREKKEGRKDADMDKAASHMVTIAFFSWLAGGMNGKCLHPTVLLVYFQPQTPFPNSPNAHTKSTAAITQYNTITTELISYLDRASWNYNTALEYSHVSSHPCITFITAQAKCELNTSRSCSSSMNVLPLLPGLPRPKLSGAPVVVSIASTVYRNSHVSVAVPSMRCGSADSTHQAAPPALCGRTRMGTRMAGWMASSELSATTNATLPRARPSTLALFVTMAWMTTCLGKKCFTMVTSGKVDEADDDGRALMGFVEWMGSPRFNDFN
mmetsp:Transcript_9223/g.24902  ORF Transcript_9223/g.24902 Transcript_9223/m.24902 type:complete len:279 (-) Transcript_9223:110-946(-)